MDKHLFPETRLQLRDYQIRGIAQLRQAVGGAKHRGETGKALNHLLVSPTGAGKTEMATGILNEVSADGRRVIFVVERLTLVQQAVDRFSSYGFSVGIIQGSNTDYHLSNHVVVATAQTLGKRMKKSPLSLDYDLVIIDEAHIMHPAHREIFTTLAGVPIIGLTATPHHRELGLHYASIVTACTTQELIDKGYLVPPRVFKPQAQVDTSGLNIKMGDYNTKQLGQRVTKITGDVVSNWQAHGEDRPTLCFAVNVSHAEELCWEFRQAGVPSDWLYCDTEADDRLEMFRKLRVGEIKVLVSVTALTAGFDMPEASCAIVARPTASEALHIQMLGRVLRTSPGKVDALVFDHAGNCARHGLPQDYLPPTLEQVEQRCSPKREASERKMSSCKECHAIMRPRERICAECGHERVLASRVWIQAGQLSEADGPPPAEVLESLVYKRQWLAEAMGYGNAKGYKPLFGAVQFNNRFGDWPSKFGIHDRTITPVACGDIVGRWIRNQQKRHYLIQRKGRRA